MGKNAFSKPDGNFATVITLKNQPSQGKQPSICGTDFVPYFPKPLRLLFAAVSHHCLPSKKKGTDLFGSVPLTGLTPTAWAVRHALAGRFAHPSVFQRFRTDGMLHLPYGFHVFDVVEVSGSDLLQAFRRPDRRRAGLGNGTKLVISIIAHARTKLFHSHRNIRYCARFGTRKIDRRATIQASRAHVRRV